MEQSVATVVTQMNFAIIFAVTFLAAMLAVAFYWVAMGGRWGRRSPAKSQIEALDVSAFNNLIDPAEEDFLRRELPPALFRSIQRLRLRAAIEYVSCASRNAGLLIRMGKSVGAQSAPEHSRQAHEMVTAAVQLRLLSLFVLCLLWIKIAFPALRLSLKEVSTLHVRLVAQQSALGRVKLSGDALHSA